MSVIKEQEIGTKPSADAYPTGAYAVNLAMLNVIRHFCVNFDFMGVLNLTFNLQVYWSITEKGYSQSVENSLAFMVSSLKCETPQFTE